MISMLMRKYILLSVVLISILFGIYIFQPSVAETDVSISIQSGTNSITTAETVGEVIIPIQKLNIKTQNIATVSEPLDLNISIVNQRTQEKIKKEYHYDVSENDQLTVNKAIPLSKFSESSYPENKTTDLKISVTANHPDTTKSVATEVFTIDRVVNRTSCKTILESDPKASSGVYTLESGGQSFNTYCDMEYDGGGWTAVMALDDDDNKFGYDSNYWTNKDTYMANDSNPFDSGFGADLDGPRKYASYYLVDGDDLRLEFGNPDRNIVFQGNMEQESAYNIFTGGSQLTYGTYDGSGTTCTDDAHGVADHPYVYPDGNDGKEQMPLSSSIAGSGVNIESTTGTRDSRVRFGVVSEEDTYDGYSNPRYTVGFEGRSIDWSGYEGESTDCLVGTNGNSYDTSGVLWVR